MARRRYQSPEPVVRGRWWTLLVWRDHFVGAERKRKRERVKLAPATMPVQEVRKLRDEYLRPLNSGLESIGSATNFTKYVDDIYIPAALKAMATAPVA